MFWNCDQKWHRGRRNLIRHIQIHLHTITNQTSIIIHIILVHNVRRPLRMYRQPQHQLLHQIQLQLKGRVIQQIDLLLRQISARIPIRVHVEILDPLASIVLQRLGDILKSGQLSLKCTEVGPTIKADKARPHFQESLVSLVNNLLLILLDCLVQEIVQVGLSDLIVCHNLRLSKIVVEGVHGKNDVEMTSVKHGGKKAKYELGKELFDLFGACDSDGTLVGEDVVHFAKQELLDQRPGDVVAGLDVVNELKGLEDARDIVGDLGVAVLCVLGGSPLRIENVKFKYL